MITAKEANKKAFESEKAKELLKEKHYQEILKKVEDKISEYAEKGRFIIDLKTNFMYPFRDKIIEELRRNGYDVELFPSGIVAEHLWISWK